MIIHGLEVALRAQSLPHVKLEPQRPPQWGQSTTKRPQKQGWEVQFPEAWLSHPTRSPNIPRDHMGRRVLSPHPVSLGLPGAGEASATQDPQTKPILSPRGTNFLISSPLMPAPPLGLYPAPGGPPSLHPAWPQTRSQVMPGPPHAWHRASAQEVFKEMRALLPGRWSQSPSHLCATIPPSHRLPTQPF